MNNYTEGPPQGPQRVERDPNEITRRLNVSYQLESAANMVAESVNYLDGIPESLVPNVRQLESEIRELVSRLLFASIEVEDT